MLTGQGFDKGGNTAARGWCWQVRRTRTPHKREGERGPCPSCTEAQEACAAALKRTEVLEASMRWVSAEFVALHTEFVHICEEAPKTPVSTPK